ncbi:MAG TPA: DUF6600 domain-containing protein [Verrucomicrobiae bacterium]|nr:DUF6600 domain-containing protein [Verrucomicrobiae bacterium]
MRSRIIGFIMMVMLGLPALASADGLGFVRISLLEGDVQIRTEETGEWAPAALNTPLREGDSIWTPDNARVEIQFRDGTVVRLDERTAVDIFAAEEDAQQFRVETGRLYVKTGRNTEQFLELEIPQGLLKVYNSARFRVDVPADDSQRVSVFRGVVHVEGRAAKTQVKTGEVLTVEGSRADLITASPRPDEWDRWNTRRDDKLERRYVSSRYVPGELEPYTADLDDNGEWLYERDYGYVWRPRVVAVDWSPYRVGRWVWIGGDYVWISHENWGWAPYHYGRWVHTPYRGWCWVPPVRGDVYWSPGYVAWVNTPTYIGWVPLAPGEVYYGRGYYGRHSANITQVNITINKTVVKNYRNINVTNAVTVVEKDSFATGKPRHVKVKENIFVSREVSYGRPEVKPRGRDAYAPAVKTVNADKLPPERIRRRPVEELKERREKRKEEIRVVREERKRDRQEQRSEQKIEKREEKEQRKDDRLDRTERRRDLREQNKLEKREEKEQRREKRQEGARPERTEDGVRGFQREEAPPADADHGNRGRRPVRSFERSAEGQDSPPAEGDKKQHEPKREKKKVKIERREGEREEKRKDKD